MQSVQTRVSNRSYLVSGLWSLVCNEIPKRPYPVPGLRTDHDDADGVITGTPTPTRTRTTDGRRFTLLFSVP